MKSIFEHIKIRTATFRERPLFLYLRDEKVTPHERLKFAPYVGHFVMTIADLWPLFGEYPPGDRFQEIVNEHIRQEENHREWFLSDLERLNLAPSIRFTDALRFIWSDSAVKTRRISYEICRLLRGATALEKLVLIYSIEATARTSFEAATVAACGLEAASGVTLSYMGRHHLTAELDHTAETEAVHRSLEQVGVSDVLREDLQNIVDTVFAYFSEFVDEVFELAKGGCAVLQGSTKGARNLV